MAERRPQVVLVRHGQTEWSLSGQHTGRTDIPLTDVGRQQAELLGASLEHWRFARVMTSPMSRATETARLAGYGDVAEHCDDLREWDYGRYEGMTTPDIRVDDPGWTVWSHAVPEGETAEEVGRRADRVIEAARSAGGDVALFGHGHMLRVLGARWCGLAATDGRRLALDTSAICVLGYERDQPVLRQWNLVAWEQPPPVAG